MTEPDLIMPDDLNSWDKLVPDTDLQQNLLRVLHQIKEEQPVSRSKKMANILLLDGSDKKVRTAAAILIGRELDRPVHRIDLSSVTSAYIGETEKNLRVIFDVAASKKWILFFDEADALFGNRTGVKDAHDRYANQEVTYLMQRIEEYPGISILATNRKVNIDDAFMRRLRFSIRL